MKKNVDLEKIDLENIGFKRIEMKDIKLGTVYCVKHIDKGSFKILALKKTSEILHAKILEGLAVTKLVTRTDIREPGEIVSFNPDFARMKEVGMVE
jgi:hypothetical protein